MSNICLFFVQIFYPYFVTKFTMYSLFAISDTRYLQITKLFCLLCIAYPWTNKVHSFISKSWTESSLLALNILEISNLPRRINYAESLSKLCISSTSKCKQFTNTLTNKNVLLHLSFIFNLNIWLRRFHLYQVFVLYVCTYTAIYILLFTTRWVGTSWAKSIHQ